MRRPVAGVAMGLLLEAGGRFAVLTDILGSEDAMGDMDFKVAGDATHITAFQMDIKACTLSVCLSRSLPDECGGLLRSGLSAAPPSALGWAPGKLHHPAIPSGTACCGGMALQVLAVATDASLSYCWLLDEIMSKTRDKHAGRCG